VSSNTWTPREVARKASRTSVRLWRAVEAQHVSSTLQLVDNLEEQEVLEDILEETKPSIPAAARKAKLHYLLFTPFRYHPSSWLSRFRGPNDPGVFYGADVIKTACAELGYWRWRFLIDSKGLERLGPAPQTLFETSVDTLGVDLEKLPFSRDSGLWQHPNDYTATQAFARVTREAGVRLIRYRSVRDQEVGRCGAVLHPDAFRSPNPISPTQTWMLTITQDFVFWQRDGEAFQFNMERWKPVVSKNSAEGLTPPRGGSS